MLERIIKQIHANQLIKLKWHSALSLTQVRLIIDALKKNQSVTDIDLSSCEIGSEASKMFAEILEKNERLVLLNLDNNSIGDEAIKILAKALVKNHSLKTLSLMQNKICNDGGYALSEMLKINRTLTRIFLRKNSIRKTGGECLKDALTINKAVVEISLEYNGMGEQLKLEIYSMVHANAEKSPTNLSAIPSPLAAFYYNRGLELVRIASYEAAIRELITAIKLNPNNAEYYYDLGLAYASLNLFDEAISEFDKAINLNSKKAEYYYCRGSTKYSLEQNAEAIEDYDKAISLDPIDSTYYFNRSLAKRALLQNQQAIEDLDIAIELDPNNAEYYYGLGLAYDSLNLFNQAIREFDKAINLNSTEAEYYHSRGSTKYSLKQNTEAIKDYDKAISLDPDNDIYYYSCSLAKSALFQHQQAIEDLDIAIELDPNDDEYYNRRGLVKCQLRLYNSAKQDFNNAIRLNPNNAGYYYNRSVVNRSLGFNQEAQFDIQQGNRLNPDYTTENTLAAPFNNLTLNSNAGAETTSSPMFGNFKQGSPVASVASPPQVSTSSQPTFKFGAASTPPLFGTKPKTPASPQPAMFGGFRQQPSQPAPSFGKFEPEPVAKPKTPEPSQPAFKFGAASTSPLFGAKLKTPASPQPAPSIPATAIKLEPSVSWHFSEHLRDLGRELVNEDGYALIPAGSEDIAKVIAAYQFSPVPKKDIQRIDIIYSPRFNRQFDLEIDNLNRRTNKDLFAPDWQAENDASLRSEVDKLCQTLAAPHKDPNFPNVKLMWAWHGTKEESLSSIFEVGYANLATTDAGYFGQGLYSTINAKYAHQMYGYGGPLILNYVCFFSAYPAVYSDTVKFYGKALPARYDACFAPILHKDGELPVQQGNVIRHIKRDDYFGLAAGEKHTYIELMVTNPRQCLPRYLVTLQPTLPKIPVNLGGNPHTIFYKGKVDSIVYINLIAAAKYVYENYLSTPYTLKTGVEWNMDWEYLHPTTKVKVHRPNHGFPHVWRTMSYVPLALKLYIEHQKLSGQEAKQLKNDINIIQLALLFLVAGRENDAGSRHNPTAYRRFREQSMNLFERFIKEAGIKISPEKLKFYKQALLSEERPHEKNYFNHISTIIWLCHNIDTMRCLTPEQYAACIEEVNEHVGKAGLQLLVKLVEINLDVMGDRILGLDDSCDYDPDLFVQANSSVEACIKLSQEAWCEFEKVLQSEKAEKSALKF